MLLGNKKTQKEERNWCVVLDTINSQMNRAQVAQVLSHTFSLSRDEANDVVSNTPIILLDNLSQSVASRVKDYFNVSGASMILTNDLLKKRKYYRTVWPEKPNLNFLHAAIKAKPSPAPSEVNQSQALAPDEALNELRSITKKASEPKKKEPLPEPKPLPAKKPVAEEKPFESPIKPLLDDEKVMLKMDLERKEKENRGLLKELQRLQEKLRVHEAETERAQTIENMGEAEIQKREEEIRELKVLLANTQERYEVLKEESRRVKSVFDEKIDAVKKEESDKYATAVVVKQENENLQLQNEALVEKLYVKEQECEILHKKAGESKEFLESKLEHLTEEISEAKRNNERLTFELKTILKAKESMEKDFSVQIQELQEWKNKCQIHEEKMESLKKDCQVMKDHKKKAEERLAEVEQSQLRLLKDFEQQTKLNDTLNAQAAQNEEKVREYEKDNEDKERLLEMNMKHQLLRDQEIENLRGELGEVNRMLMERETYHKRELNEARKSEKESRLKRLVSEQQQIEDEVRVREEAIRKILAEQAVIEREIIEDKEWHYQSRQLAEKNKSGSRLQIKKGDDVPQEEVDPVMSQDKELS